MFCHRDPLLLGLVIRLWQRSRKDKQPLHQLHQEPWPHTEHLSLFVSVCLLLSSGLCTACQHHACTEPPLLPPSGRRLKRDSSEGFSARISHTKPMFSGQRAVNWQLFHFVWLICRNQTWILSTFLNSVGFGEIIETKKKPACFHIVSKASSNCYCSLFDLGITGWCKQWTLPAESRIWTNDTLEFFIWFFFLLTICFELPRLFLVFLTYKPKVRKSTTDVCL